MFDQSITCIENFSNEIFYEIFDYLDGCEIYDAFLNLNHRFKQLINSSSLQLKVNFDLPSDRPYENIYKHLLNFNQHQILSINLSTINDDIIIFTTCSINSLFDRLESLTIHTMEPELVISLLVNLNSLPCLILLNITGWDPLEKAVSAIPAGLKCETRNNCSSDNQRV
jgi:hypothetical protein